MIPIAGTNPLEHTPDTIGPWTLGIGGFGSLSLLLDRVTRTATDAAGPEPAAVLFTPELVIRDSA